MRLWVKVRGRVGVRVSDRVRVRVRAPPQHARCSGV